MQRPSHPILGWQVFESAKKAKAKISPNSWSGWLPEWEPFAVEITGDAEPEFIAKNDATFEAFIVDYMPIKRRSAKMKLMN